MKTNLDKSLDLFYEKYKHYLDDFGAHELRFSYGFTPSGNYSACFTFEFPRSGADIKYLRNFNKMVEDFRNCFNFEEGKQYGADWCDTRDKLQYNFINPTMKTKEIYCSFDKIEWYDVQMMKSLLETNTETVLHIRYISTLSHFDILTGIGLAELIKSAVNEKYNSNNYLKEVDEDEMLKTLSRYLNRAYETDSCIKYTEIEKTVDVEYFLENY